MPSFRIAVAVEKNKNGSHFVMLQINSKKKELTSTFRNPN
jgi:hypothetical protein